MPKRSLADSDVKLTSIGDGFDTTHRFTVPSIDYLGRDFQRLVGYSTPYGSWIHSDFTS